MGKEDDNGFKRISKEFLLERYFPDIPESPTNGQLAAVRCILAGQSIPRVTREAVLEAVDLEEPGVALSALENGIDSWNAFVGKGKQETTKDICWANLAISITLSYGQNKRESTLARMGYLIAAIVETEVID